MTDLFGSYNRCPAVRRNDHICDTPGPRGCGNAQSFRRSSRGSVLLWNTSNAQRKTGPGALRTPTRTLTHLRPLRHGRGLW